MPNSIREQILQAVMQTLTPVAAGVGATLARSPTEGITREASPALLLFPESDVITARPNDRVERQLTIRLVALARGSDADAQADRLLVASHAALWANLNFGGLVLGLQELDCEWDQEDSDAGACASSARYQLTYRTLAADLSQLG